MFCEFKCATLIIGEVAIPMLNKLESQNKNGGGIMEVSIVMVVDTNCCIILALIAGCRDENCDCF